MAKNKKQTKIDQANMQSDALTSDGIQYSGSEDTFTYSFADLDDDFDAYSGTVSTASMSIDGLSLGPNEEELRDKYPALKDAWDHYNNVKHMCEQKEKENED